MGFAGIEGERELPLLNCKNIYNSLKYGAGGGAAGRPASGATR